MPNIPRRIIEKSLSQKGFVRKKKKKDHRWYIFHYGGKSFPNICAQISHGSGYKDYGPELIGKMKKLLRLNSITEVCNLLECPMTQESYEQKLRDNGLI